MKLFSRSSNFPNTRAKEGNIGIGVSVSVADKNPEAIGLSGTANARNREAEDIGNLTGGFQLFHGLLLENDPRLFVADLAFILSVLRDHRGSDRPEHIRESLNSTHSHYSLVDFAILSVCRFHLNLLNVYCIASCTINKGIDSETLCSFHEERIVI